MKHLLICLLAASTLSGCGVFGSDESSPNWTGDWKVTENFNGELPENETYLSYSEKRTTSYTADPEGGCTIRTFEIIEVNDNEVRIASGNELLTERLTVSNEELIATVTRSNRGFVEGESRRATSVEEDPRDLLGCGGSAATAGTAQEWAPALKQDR
jgi:hypothetical protein